MRSRLVALVLILAAGAFFLGVSGGSQNTASAQSLPPGAQAGNEGNTDPVLGTVQSWTDLSKAGKDLPGYQACLAARNGTTWAQVQQFADMEAKGTDLRAIVISNLSVTDDQARAALTAQGFANLPTRIIRTGNLDNTRGLGADKCQKFDDTRQQVRIALTAPDGTPLVLAMCSNPLGKNQPPPETSPTATSPGCTNCGTVPTVPPCTNCGTVPPCTNCGTVPTVPPCTNCGTVPTVPPCTNCGTVPPCTNCGTVPTVPPCRSDCSPSTTLKCPDGSNRDGSGHCGTARTGGEQQPVTVQDQQVAAAVANPSGNGAAAAVVQQQQQAPPTGDANTATNTAVGTQSATPPAGQMGSGTQGTVSGSTPGITAPANTVGTGITAPGGDPGTL